MSDIERPCFELFGSTFILPPAPEDLRAQNLPAEFKPKPTVGLSSMLSRQAEHTPFTGREGEFQKLLQWATEGPDYSFLHVVGETGTGKNSLAAELVQTLRSKGWTAGPIRQTGKRTRHLASDKGTLLVLNDPEEENHTNVNLFDLRKAPQGLRVRILILCRNEANRQRSLTANRRFNPCFVPEPMRLGPLTAEAGTVIVRAMQDAASDILPKTTSPPPALSEDDITAWLNVSPMHGYPLFLKALALHAVLFPEVPALESTGPEIMRRLAQHEMKQQAERSRVLTGNPNILPRLCALTSMLDKPTWDTICKHPDILTTVGVQDAHPFRQLLEDEGWLSNEEIFSIPPSIFGSAFVCEVFAGNPSLGRELTWLAAEHCFNASINNFSLLTWNIERHFEREHSPAMMLERALDDRPEDWDKLYGLTYSSFFGCRNNHLARLQRHVTDLAIDKMDDLTSKITHIRGLARYHHINGDIDEPLRLGTEVVNMYKKQPPHKDLRRDSDLACSLHDLSCFYEKLGYADKSIEALSEAVDIQRACYEEGRSFMYQNDLFNMLNDLSKLHATVGNTPEAIKTTQEWIILGEKLLDYHPSCYQFEYMKGLVQLGAFFEQAGNLNEAIELDDRALSLCQKTEKDQPHFYRYWLAQVLLQKGTHLGRRQDCKEAAEHVTRAKDVFLMLEEQEPKRHLTDIICCHCALGQIHSTQDLHQARQNYEQCLSLLGPCLEQDPDKYREYSEYVIQCHQEIMNQIQQEEDSGPAPESAP